MKIFNISNLLFIVFTTLFLSIKAQKVDSINIKKTVINNQIQNTSLQFNIKNSTYSFNDRSDLQKNLDFLKVKTKRILSVFLKQFIILMELILLNKLL